MDLATGAVETLASDIPNIFGVRLNTSQTHAYVTTSEFAPTGAPPGELLLVDLATGAVSPRESSHLLKSRFMPYFITTEQFWSPPLPCGRSKQFWKSRPSPGRHPLRHSPLESSFRAMTLTSPGVYTTWAGGKLPWKKPDES